MILTTKTTTQQLFISNLFENVCFFTKSFQVIYIILIVFFPISKKKNKKEGRAFS